jgi:hypothetical protein
MAAAWLEGEVSQTEQVAGVQIAGAVWLPLCIYVRRCPTGQIKRRGNKMAKKTLKKSKKIEATKPLTVALGKH